MCNPYNHCYPGSPIKEAEAAKSEKSGGGVKKAEEPKELDGPAVKRLIRAQMFAESQKAYKPGACYSSCSMLCVVSWGGCSPYPSRNIRRHHRRL